MRWAENEKDSENIFLKIFAWKQEQNKVLKCKSFYRNDWSAGGMWMKLK